MIKIKMLVAALISTVCLTSAIAVSANQEMVSSLGALRAQQSYTCGDIVFSESVGNPGSYSDIADLAAEGVTSLNCSMTDWTNANYLKNKNSAMTESAIKIGGSKTGKYSGSVKLTLNGGMTASKLIIYATGWSGDTGDIQLGVNGSYQSITNTTDSYVFTPYTFNFGATNELILSNTAGATGKRRLVISKIVLRLYN